MLGGRADERCVFVRAGGVEDGLQPADRWMSGPRRSCRCERRSIELGVDVGGGVGEHGQSVRACRHGHRLVGEGGRFLEPATLDEPVDCPGGHLETLRCVGSSHGDDGVEPVDMGAHFEGEPEGLTCLPLGPVGAPVHQRVGCRP